MKTGPQLRSILTSGSTGLVALYLAYSILPALWYRDVDMANIHAHWSAGPVLVCALCTPVLLWKRLPGEKGIRVCLIILTGLYVECWLLFWTFLAPASLWATGDWGRTTANSIGMVVFAGMSGHALWFAHRQTGGAAGRPSWRAARGPVAFCLAYCMSLVVLFWCSMGGAQRYQLYMGKLALSLGAGDYAAGLQYCETISDMGPSGSESQDVAFLTQRACAYSHLGNREMAERDCRQILHVVQGMTTVQAVFFRGVAKMGLGYFPGAADDLHEALGRMPEDHPLYLYAREQYDVVRSQLRTH